MSREPVSRGRVRGTPSVSVPAETAAVDVPQKGIAVPEDLDLLDVITNIPFESLISASACYWGDLGSPTMVPEEGTIHLFGLLPGGAPMSVEIAQSNEGYNNHLPGTDVMDIMAGLGLTPDNSKTERRQGKKSKQDYLVVHYQRAAA